MIIISSVVSISVITPSRTHIHQSLSLASLLGSIFLFVSVRPSVSSYWRLYASKWYDIAQMNMLCICFGCCSISDENQTVNQSTNLFAIPLTFDCRTWLWFDESTFVLVIRTIRNAKLIVSCNNVIIHTRM